MERGFLLIIIDKILICLAIIFFSFSCKRKHGDLSCDIKKVIFHFPTNEECGTTYLSLELQCENKSHKEIVLDSLAEFYHCEGEGTKGVNDIYIQILEENSTSYINYKHSNIIRLGHLEKVIQIYSNSYQLVNLFSKLPYNKPNDVSIIYKPLLENNFHLVIDCDEHKEVVFPTHNNPIFFEINEELIPYNDSNRVNILNNKYFKEIEIDSSM